MAVIRAEKKKPSRKYDDEEGLMDMPIRDLGMKSVTSFSLKSKTAKNDKDAKSQADKKKEEEEKKKAEEAPKINYGSKKIVEVLDDINYARDRVFSRIVVPEDTSNMSKKKKRKSKMGPPSVGRSMLNETLDLGSTSPIKVSPEKS